MDRQRQRYGPAVSALGLGLAWPPLTALAVLVAVAWSPSVGRAEVAEACPVSDSDYMVIARVVVKNTAFGAANGEFPLGSGTMKLHLERAGGQAAVKLMAFELDNRLSVDVKAAIVSGRVVTTSHTTTTRNPLDGSARGTLNASLLTWSTKVSGYRSDGTMECSGSMCGKFGAPPKGMSPFHDVPPSLTFTPFTLSPDGSTFTMPYTPLSKSDSPRQTTYLALSGRRVRQTCAGPTPTSTPTSAPAPTMHPPPPPPDEHTRL